MKYNLKKTMINYEEYYKNELLSCNFLKIPKKYSYIENQEFYNEISKKCLNSLYFTPDKFMNDEIIKNNIDKLKNKYEKHDLYEYQRNFFDMYSYIRTDLCKQEYTDEFLRIIKLFNAEPYKHIFKYIDKIPEHQLTGEEYLYSVTNNTCANIKYIPRKIKTKDFFNITNNYCYNFFNIYFYDKNIHNRRYRTSIREKYYSG